VSPAGHEWVRVGDDALPIGGGGVVLQVARGVFAWRSRRPCHSVTE